uniref:hypothetical protein n=1 Tax=Halobellus salinisoli TaxID=3108500 RepID=UPI00300B920D
GTRTRRHPLIPHTPHSPEKHPHQRAHETARLVGSFHFETHAVIIKPRPTEQTRAFSHEHDTHHEKTINSPEEIRSHNAREPITARSGGVDVVDTANCALSTN